MFVYKWWLNRGYKQQREQYIAERDRRIEKLRSDLAPHFAKIDQGLKTSVINMTVCQLVELLNSGKVSSQTLTLVFIEQTLNVGFKLGNAVQQCFLQALDMARLCDQKRQGRKNWTFERPGEDCLPPLYGVPMTLKESILQKGCISTLGCTNLLQEKASEDGYICSKLRRAGAIFFVRSNMPQSLITYESNNPIYGRAKNPWNNQRSSGGSSGGEAGLISSGCAPVGMGTDTGGSIRCPAQFCGIYGLKPTPFRVASFGQKSVGPHFGADRAVPYVFGPLGKSPRDLALVFRVLCNPQFQNCNPDPFTLPCPFDISRFIERKRGKVGYFLSHPSIPAGPSAQRAVEEAVAGAKAAGYQIEPIFIQCFHQSYESFVQMMLASGSDMYEYLPKGEYIIPELSSTLLITKMNSVLRSILSFVLSFFFPRGAKMLQLGKMPSGNELLRLMDRQKQMQLQLVESLRKKGIEFVLCPAFATRALKHGLSKDSVAFAGYLSVWNYLRLPTMVLPVTVCRPQEQVYNTPHNDMLDAVGAESEAGAAGMPAGVQIVGLPFSEQRILGLAEQLDNVIGFRTKHPYPTKS